MQSHFDQTKPRVTTYTQRAELLDQTGWLQDLSWNQIKLMAKFVKVYDIPEKTVLFDEGDKAYFLGVISEGQVVVRKKSKGESSQIIARLGKGKTFGEMSLVDGAVRSASVSTQTPIVLITLSHNDFETLLHEASKLGVCLLLKIGKLMSANLRRTSALLIDSLEHQEH